MSSIVTLFSSKILGARECTDMESQPATERQPTQGPQLLTPPQLCEFLQIKLDRLYELVWTRRLRAVRVGRQLRFRPRDIEAFLERSTIA